MFISDPLPFVKNYIEEIDAAIKKYDENAKLTRIQKAWLAFCIMAIFFEDWKISEGWGKLTKHTGEKGSRRGVILSLLTDHCLFFHPDQQAFIEENLAACTVGSLIRQIRIECFLEFVRDMVTDDDPNRKLDDLAELLKNEIYQLISFYLNAPSSQALPQKIVENEQN